jgi:hypothetical protein
MLAFLLFFLELFSIFTSHLFDSLLAAALSLGNFLIAFFDCSCNLGILFMSHAFQLGSCLLRSLQETRLTVLHKGVQFGLGFGLDRLNLGISIFRDGFDFS